MSRKLDIKETLNLPRTEFPMQANLPQSEPKLLQRWEEDSLYTKIRETRREKDVFILHDGPPYANGHIHLGQALNKILKDTIVRSRIMMGFDTPFIPGWDCHGLPIELQVEKALERGKGTLTAAAFRKRCQEYAEKFISIQREEFKRLGILGDWENPYLTMSPRYESAIAEAFFDFLEQGNVYRGMKPVHWCYSCQTALAEAEVEYREKDSPSIHVAFPLTPESHAKVLRAISPSGSKGGGGQPGNQTAAVLIWTTTPWTLPANLAIAFHPSARYALVRPAEDAQAYIVAEALLSEVQRRCGWKEVETLGVVEGRDLDTLECFHPFLDRKSLLIVAEAVNLEEGTGCVHIAPGHGQEDYELGQRHDLPPLAPLDDAGRFTPEFPNFADVHVFDANSGICDLLEENRALLAQSIITHSYPHCWRCGEPVLFRATPQWFIALDTNDLREKALEEIQRVNWLPQWGQERMHRLLSTRPDWCISRQRLWGVPLLIISCGDCGTAVFDSAIRERLLQLISNEGSGAWFEKEAAELLPPDTTCDECGGATFERATDILDVWFDSGTSHRVLDERELPWPADLYIEGNDQFRGWYHSSLLIGIETKGGAPYESVLTHGMIVDEQGNKMSKSRGNVIAPQEIVKRYGAEVLRLWVAMRNYTEEMKLSFDILEQNAETYRKLRNTCRFCLGNLYDFDPSEDSVPYEEMEEIDRWILNRLERLGSRLVLGYESYDFLDVSHGISDFAITDLSAFYLDIIKDRLYTSGPVSGGRRSAQTALYQLALRMSQFMAPILPFTAEEVWLALPQPADGEESVHLSLFPTFEATDIEPPLVERWERLIDVRDQVLKALEEARQQQLIGNSLEAKVTLDVPASLGFLHDEDPTFLAQLFIVSQVALGEAEKPNQPSAVFPDLVIQVDPAEGQKCQRCWTFSPSVGEWDRYPTVCSRCREVIQELEDLTQKNNAP